MTKMANVRGVAIASLFKYIREKAGEKSLKEILATRDEQVRKELLSLKPRDWHPYEKAQVLYRVIDEKIGKGDPNFWVELGKYTAEDNLKWFLKLFLSFATPKKIVKKWPTLYSLYFDEGELQVVKLGDKSATTRLSDIDITHNTCLIIRGWGELSLEKAGAKNIQIKEVKCIEKGDGYTEWENKWE